MLPTVRAQPTTFSPCWTNARATAAPMPPEAPVTSASRSRHRSMPALVMIPSRLPTSFGEPGTGIAELRLRLLKLGGSLVTEGVGAGNLEMLELRLDPPPGGPASGRGSALGTSVLGHMASGVATFSGHAHARARACPSCGRRKPHSLEGRGPPRKWGLTACGVAFYRELFPLWWRASS